MNRSEGRATSGPAAPLSLRMRPDLCVFAQRYDGRRVWCIKDPVALSYHHLQDEEYAILQMLDGNTSLEQVREQFQARFAPLRLTLVRLYSFLSTLHRSGLLLSDSAGQGDVFQQRHDERQQMIRKRFWMSLLAIRLPGIDPTPVLDWLYPRCRGLYSRGGSLACGLLILTSLLLVATSLTTISARLPSFDAFFNAGNAGLIVVVFLVVKIAHELGHALACRHFGRQCHEMGVLLLAFMPCLYCNVSDAWTLSDKWSRIAIAAAGIHVELIIAAIATWLWWFSEPGLLNTICLNTMFVCSIGTFLFNANPLLRYDGYYVLADYLEIPNLHQQSRELLRSMLARFFVGRDLTNRRALPIRRQRLLTAYAVAALTYRFVVVGVILGFLYHTLLPYRLEAIAVAIGMVTVVGIGTAAATDARDTIRRMRHEGIDSRRLSGRASLVIAVIVAVLQIPLPFRIRSDAVLQPASKQTVYVTAPGTITSALTPGHTVRKDQTIATLSNHDLSRDIVRLSGERDRLQVHVEHLETRRLDSVTDLPAAQQRLRDVEKRLEEKRHQNDRLHIVAPADGTVLPVARKPRTQKSESELESWFGSPLDETNQGCFLEVGTPLCSVGDPKQLEAILVVAEADVPFLATGQKVLVSLRQGPRAVLRGTIDEIAKLQMEDVPEPLASSGQLSMQTDSAGGQRPMTVSYRVRVRLADDSQSALIGSRGVAKVFAQPRSLATRLISWLRGTFRFRA